MIPEKEREALEHLTMCAREECSMCKYQGSCNFDFQYELATKNMNILADALRQKDDEHIKDAIERMEYLKAKAQIALEDIIPEWIAEDILGTIEAYDTAIEALQAQMRGTDNE